MEPSIRFTTATCTSRMRCARRSISSALCGFRPAAPRTRLARSSAATATGSPCSNSRSPVRRPIEISTIDIDRSGPSYTADTLEILAERFAPARLFFLMGEDSLRDLPTWHDPERLLRVAELAVAARPGVDADLESVARQVPAVQGRVHLVPTEEIAISSSEIRRRVRRASIDPRTGAGGCRGIHSGPRALHRNSAR